MTLESSATQGRSRLRVLEVATVDYVALFLLLPLVDRLIAEGFEVEIACNEGQYSRQLKARGYQITYLDLSRRLSPWHNLRDMWRLYRLARRGRYDVVHVHTPITAVIGRIAARLARVRMIVYTAHGFPFHEGMRWPFRWAAILLERVLSRWFTHLVLTQSKEDYELALSRRIIPPQKLRWIGNGVSLQLYSPKGSGDGARREFGLPENAKVVGFIGRLVAEKGVIELFEAMRIVVRAVPEAHLLVVGDALPSDRDRQTKGIAVEMASQAELAGRVTFLGLLDDVHRVLQAVNVVTLPSYREGFPRSIIEAMAAGKPVVATNIRGCREATVHEETGFLVPVGDVQALANRLLTLLGDDTLAKGMGTKARARAVELFDEEQVLQREMEALNESLLGVGSVWSQT